MYEVITSRHAASHRRPPTLDSRLRVEAENNAKTMLTGVLDGTVLAALTNDFAIFRILLFAAPSGCGGTSGELVSLSGVCQQPLGIFC